MTRAVARTTGVWKCYGLTTADRPARQAHLSAELERIELPFEILVAQRPVDAGGFASIGARGCFESHLRALRAARDEGVDTAILVEDDAVIVSRFLHVLPDIERELAGRDWSMVLLGYMGDQSPARHFPIRRVSAHLAEAEHWEFIGSHFVAINGSSLDELIEHFEDRLRPGGHRIGVDGVLNEFRSLSGHPTLVAVPNLSQQGPSPSGIVGQAGMRSTLLNNDAVQRVAESAKRCLWGLESMMPVPWLVTAWNLRARLTARRRQQYLSGVPVRP